MAKRRGFEAAFDEPLILTWSLARLCRQCRLPSESHFLIKVGRPDDAVNEAIAVFIAKYHQHRGLMADLECGLSPKEIYSAWKACSLDSNAILRDVLEICHVEVMRDDDEG